MGKIQKIAQRANVSVSAVSKALNGYGDISVKTKERILQIAEEMEYTPSNKLKKLPQKKSNLIGLVVSNIDESPASGEMIYKMFTAVKKISELNGYELVLITTDSEKQKKKSLSCICKEYRFAGCIISGMSIGDEYCEQVKNLDIPCTVLDIIVFEGENTEGQSSSLSAVTIDNYLASKQILSILYNKGHKNIGLINGDTTAEVSIMREKGYRDFLIENSIQVVEEYIRYAGFQEHLALDEVKLLLTLYPEITAVFCTSDIMAIGAYKGISELGLKIPDDVAVVGFDGISLTEYITPKLTTVVQNFSSMAGTGCEFLISMINGNMVDKLTYIPYNIKIRDSI